MLAGDKKGIVCDYCMVQYNDQFTYYAVEYCTIQVSTSKLFTTLPKLKLETDMCSHCYDKLIEHITKDVRPEMKMAIPCDTCSHIMTGDFNYYYTKFAQVKIDRSAQPPNNSIVTKKYMESRICIKCFDNVSTSIKNNIIKIKSRGEWT